LTSKRGTFRGSGGTNQRGGPGPPVEICGENVTTGDEICRSQGEMTRGGQKKKKGIASKKG